MKVTINEKHTMKYTTKTAIEIMTEEDKPQLIPFMESIKGDCNKINAWLYNDKDMCIGDIWFINPNGYLRRNYIDLVPSDYTILKGVPKNWREDMDIERLSSGFNETFPNFNREPKQHKIPNEYGKINDIPEKLGVTISSPETELQSKIELLESENKELREWIENVIRRESMYSVKGQNSTLKPSEIRKAKQLLEK